MDANFLHQPASTDDGYGSRLTLRFDPAVTPNGDLGQTVFASIRLELDGTNVPVIAFPRAPDGTPDWSVRTLPRRGAICAAVLVRDISGDLDELDIFEIKQSAADRASGSSRVVDKAGRVAVRVVAMMRGNRTQQDAFPAIRTVTATTAIGVSAPPTGIPQVWLAEAIRPGRELVPIRMHYLDESGIQESFGDFQIRALTGAPLNFQLNQSTISLLTDSDSEAYVLHSRDRQSAHQTFVYLDASDRSQEEAKLPFNSVFAISASSSVFGWVAGKNRLAWVTPGIIDPGRLVEKVMVRSLASGLDLAGGTWAAVDRLDDGTRKIRLGHFSHDGENDFIVDGVREASNVNFGNNRWMLLEILRDEGVIAYANYKRVPSLLRVSSAGVVTTISSEPVLGVLNMGVNPVTGEVAVASISPATRRGRITLYDAALAPRRVFETDDPAFAGEFESIYSTAVTVGEYGTRIWVTGSRRERLPSGQLVTRGAVGFLNDNEMFTLVTGGLGVQTLVLAYVG